jgi:starch-binding outer membrane protein, SusD/RagB family
MRTSNIFRFVSLGLLFIPFACSDFLEKLPQGNLTQATFPKNASDALLATNAVYNTLRESNFNSGLFPLLDIMSDDANKGSNPGDAVNTVGPFDTFDHLKTEGSILRWWNTLYLAAKRANVVIENVPNIDMDVTLKTRYIAEAKFLRAMFYFDLVRAWGGVPIVTSTQPQTLSRSSQEDVYAFIESDLLDALAELPEKSEYSNSDTGRATRGAAKALLAKVYLYQENYSQAAAYALEVINSGQYDLEPDFDNANSQAGEHGEESVFEVGAFRNEGIENGGNQYANVQGVRGAPNRGWGFNRPTLNLRNAFEPNDPRLPSTVIFLGEVLDDITILGDPATPDASTDAHGQAEIECYNQKVWTPGDNVPAQFGHNRRMIRYAEVLLIAAEALNKDNNATQARVYLNEVRARAREGNNAILADITETNQAALHDLIIQERRVELALEGHRFWDLVRTGKAATVLGPLGFQTGKHELLPIPQTELDLTQNQLEQNPGWNN